MTPDDLEAAVTERLHQRGIRFNSADLKLFVTTAWPRVSYTVDPSVWADRFAATLPPLQPPTVHRRCGWLLFACFFAVALTSPLNLFLDGLCAGVLPTALGSTLTEGWFGVALMLLVGMVVQTGLFAALSLAVHYVSRLMPIGVRPKNIVYLTLTYLGFWFFLDVLVLYAFVSGPMP